MPLSCDVRNRKWIRKVSIRNQALREFLAETLGTFVLVCFGVGSGCQLKLGGVAMDQATAHITTGMGVMLGVMVAGGVSGGGINPAVSLAFCLTNRTPWILYPVHVIGQLIGAFVASAVMFCVYEDAINNYDNGIRTVVGDKATASMFTSFPQSYLSTEGGFLDLVVGTGIMILCILAILDEYNMDGPKGLKPLVVGFCVVCVGGALGLNSGYPVNPARDLGPRLFLWAAGWGREVFSYNEYRWFWVPVAGPITGSVVGTLLYYLFVGWHWTQEERSTSNQDCIHEEDTTSTGIRPFKTSTNSCSVRGDPICEKSGVGNLGFSSSDLSCQLTKF